VIAITNACDHLRESAAGNLAGWAAEDSLNPGFFQANLLDIAALKWLRPKNKPGKQSQGEEKNGGQGNQERRLSPQSRIQHAKPDQSGQQNQDEAEEQDHKKGGEKRVDVVHFNLALKIHEAEEFFQRIWLVGAEEVLVHSVGLGGLLGAQTSAGVTFTGRR